VRETEGDDYEDEDNEVKEDACGPAGHRLRDDHAEERDRLASVARADEPMKKPFDEKKFIWMSFRSRTKLLTGPNVRKRTR
jgi:hypothetical protein